MNKMRVAKRNEYVIEVNDAGETISFNLEDPSLPLQAEKAFEDINRIFERLKGEIVVIDKKGDMTKTKGKLMSNHQRQILEAYDKAYKDTRNAMDKFLGKGACQKIFGDSNYLSMYDELFEALEPHYEKLGIIGSNFVETIKKKYDTNIDDETLEV